MESNFVLIIVYQQPYKLYTRYKTGFEESLHILKYRFYHVAHLHIICEYTYCNAFLYERLYDPLSHCVLFICGLKSFHNIELSHLTITALVLQWQAKGPVYTRMFFISHPSICQHYGIMIIKGTGI